MELKELGMDSWFTEKVAELRKPGQEVARVMIVDRGQYSVQNEQGEVPAKATRKFIKKINKTKADMPCVGDWVCMDYQESSTYASIHTILPRKSFLRRKSAGKSNRLQMIAANIDLVFIVQSCHYDFNISRLERYLVMANEGNVEPVLILTKTDLISEDQLTELIAEIRNEGITTKIIALSNVTGSGLDQISEIMEPGNTYCLVGSSGVGKSTLINRLTGEDTMRTQSVSNSGEGRHTTVRRQLFALSDGALLIDTPGMREVGIIATASDVMDDNFDDINDLALSCRFANCGHSNEPGCAIQQAIEDGELTNERFFNYMKLKTESEQSEMSYSDRRKKGKKIESGVSQVIRQKKRS